MKKYIVMSLICFSFSVVAAEKQPASLGEVTEDTAAQSACHKPEVQGCEPCFRQCMQANGGDRTGKDVANGSQKAKAGKGTVGRQ